MHRASSSKWRGMCWLILIAAFLTQLGCSGSDDDADDCQVGCEKANRLCDFGSEGLQQCLSECRASTADQIQAARECADAAETCAEITSCRP